MTSHVGRLYAAAIAILVFFLIWAAVAARPWKTAAPDPRLQQIALRQQALKRETALVNQVLALRAKTKATSTASKTAPAVRVVTLPPLTITRTS
ncbi:MAG TPA: hypothetical protein VGQ38_04905 [Gaiellaceae bacterium]|nr:hypothetical protein [Gaiellaceae bacterium]